MPYYIAGQQVARCHFCEREPTIYQHANIDGQAAIIFVCPDHGGPRYNLPVPAEVDQVVASLERQLPRHLRHLIAEPSLVASYGKTGFSYGATPEGFYEWAYTERILTNIPATPAPQRPSLLRKFLSKFATVREP